MIYLTTYTTLFLQSDKEYYIWRHMTFNRILLDSTKLDRVPQPWEFTCRITIVIDLLRDLDKRKEGRGKEEKEKKKRFCKRVRNLKSKRRCATRLSSRLETLTFVSRAEVHCYENQLSVKRRMERWNATNAYVMDVRFLSPDGKWAFTEVTSSCTG